MVTKSSEMLDELLRDESDTLTTWEVEFIESLDKQRQREGERCWEPSQRQFTVLEKTWDKVFQ